MKKRIALLSAFTLLVSVFSLAMLPVGASDPIADPGNVIDGVSDYFFDYSQEATIRDAYVGANPSMFYNSPEGNSALSYDATVGALKISTKKDHVDSGSVGQIHFWPSGAVSGTVSTTDYPFFAVKIKMIKTDMIPTRGGLIRKSDGTGFESLETADGYEREPKPAKDQGYSYEAGNGDWQLMVFDATPNATNCPTWAGMTFSLMNSAHNKDTTLYDGEAEDLAYIAWAGAFESAAAAEAYFAATTDVKAKPQISKSKTFFGFDMPLETSYYQSGSDTRFFGYKNTNQFTYEANTQWAYDPAEKAYKISTANSTQTDKIGAFYVQHGQTDAQPYDNPAEYPIVAMKIKLARNDLGAMPTATAFMNGIAYGNANNSGTHSINLAYTDSTNTDDWQLLVVDTEATGGSWSGFRINGLTTNTEILKEGENVDLAWIQWIGAFASEADAQLFFGQTADPDAGEIPEEPPTHEALSKPTNGTNFFLDFTQGVNVQTNHYANSATPFVVAENGTTVEYDEYEGAMKISTATDFSDAGSVGKVYYYPARVDSGTIEKGTKIFAIKMKLIKTDMVPGKAIRPRNDTGGWTGEGVPAKNSTYYNYNAQNYSYEYGETGWQLLTFSATTDTATNWWNGVFYILSSNDNNGVTEGSPELIDGEPEDLAYVQWAGVFETVADAETYFAQTTDTSKKINKSPYFYYGGVPMNTHYSAFYHSSWIGVTNASYNSVAAYDATMDAYKISTKADSTDVTTAGSFSMRYGTHLHGLVNDGTAPTTKITDYPIYAIALKANRADLGTASASVDTGGLGSGAVDFTFDIAPTTEWQLITVPCPTKGNIFAGVNVKSFTNNAAVVAEGAAQDLVWIKWGGLFKTVEDAEAYFSQTVPVEKEPADTGDVLVGSGASIRKTLYGNNTQGLRFHQTLKTTKVGDKETVKYEGEDVEVKDVVVLVSTAKTLATIDGGELTKEAAETNSKVKEIAIKSCRSRVVDDTNITYEFTALLSNVKQANKNDDVCARAYILCQKADGTYVTIYGDTQITNVVEMYGVLGGASNSEFTEAVHTWMAQA